MDDPNKLRQLNRIVGETLLDLAQSGVDPEFLAEFAAKHRLKVASVLDVSPDVRAQSGLKGLIKETLIETLTELDLIGKKKPGRPASEKPASRVTVMIAGARTSVKIGYDLWSRAVEMSGSPSEATQIVKNIAAKCSPDEGNKSAWVSDRLKENLEHAASQTAKHL